MEKYTILTNDKLWLEQNAIDQLKMVSCLPQVVRAVGLPDLHAGKFPVGMALLTDNLIYPHLIGGDIGCGMSFFDTNIPLRQYKGEKWQKRLEKLTGLADYQQDWYPDSPIADLGTIGGGNHFAEFQQIETVINAELLAERGICGDHVFLLVHSGSRHYGQEIISDFAQGNGLKADGQQAAIYLRLHDDALLWASRNRQLAAWKLMRCLGFHKEMTPLIDLPHNFVEKTPAGWLHRKGAVSTKSGLAIIPGSRGSLSYLVCPNEDTEIALDSISHGAGRKWARSMCKGRLKERKSRKELRTSVYGSIVICQNDQQLYQEAPEAYKNVEQVVKILADYGLITVAAALKPLITYKG